MRDHAAHTLSLRHAIALIGSRDALVHPGVTSPGGTIMAVRKTLAVISVIAFAIAAQPAFAANGDNSAQTPSANPSNPAPAKQPRKHHSGRRHQKPSTQTGTTPSNSN
jgi:hypothetical protein